MVSISDQLLLLNKFAATHIEIVAVKIEKSKTKHPPQMYNLLHGGSGIPIMKWSGIDSEHNVMVLGFSRSNRKSMFKFASSPLTHCFWIVPNGFAKTVLELKLGIGGTSYKDFIESMHLPLQLSQVDSIVASFSRGAVRVISALMVVEINNVQ